MTNRAVTKGEFGYDQNIINNTKDYRLSIIKIGDKRTLEALEKDLVLVADVSLEMLKMIEEEFESRKTKKEMIGV